MGYHLEIGDLEVHYCNNIKKPRVELHAEKVEIDLSLLDETLEPYRLERSVGNYCFAPYAQWHGFCDHVGLSGLFFDKEREDNLLVEHSGCVPLTEKHRSEINEAFEKRNKGHPIIHLVWLHYWVNWALDNCKQPVFVNS